MPTYEFKCRSCGARFEKFMSISDNDEIHCPKCSAVAELLISTGGGFILKGSGFYANDYRKSDYGKKKKGPGSDSD